MVQFGGEVVNSRSNGGHTGTQMGSGHFADEGFEKAAYFRNLQVVDWDNNLLPLSNLHVLADHPACYNIRQGKNNVWGTYFYYGGPGRNPRCPWLTSNDEMKYFVWISAIILLLRFLFSFN